MLWGSNIPQTRTPDAHFMTEARYKGQKVIVVSPDYAGHTKFADHWLPATAGTDGALAMAMGRTDRRWTVHDYVRYPLHVGEFQRVIWSEDRENLLTHGLNRPKR